MAATELLNGVDVGRGDQGRALSRILESCAAFLAACFRPAMAPPPHLRELDARTLRDIGIPRSIACPMASAESDRIAR